MTELDPLAFQLHLTAFREDFHPRDAQGRFRKAIDSLERDAERTGVELNVTDRSTGPEDHEFGAVVHGIKSRDKYKGAASAVLQRLTDLADEYRAPLALNVGGDAGTRGTQRDGLSKPQLTAWYKRYGFVPNMGRNKDFAFTHGMIRQPRV